MSKKKVAIVDAVVAELCTNVSYLNTGKRLVTIHISDLNYEWLDAVVLLKWNAAGKDDSMVGLEAEGSWPELSGFYSWWMDDKSFCLLVVCSYCFKTSNIRTVTELGLCVASYDVEIIR